MTFTLSNKKMNDIPLVSIITITYNRCDLIHRCIESIQKQTYQNYEHIIVDGNSTDDTENVVKSYKDPHIRYKKLDTRGPEIQMREGSKMAQGKYVTFLDDDDEYLPEKINKQVQFFESLSEDYGLIYCWMTFYDIGTGRIVYEHKNTLRGDVADVSLEMPRVCGTPTLMVRKDVFESVGGTFNDSIGFLMSDWEMAARICQITKVDYIPESLVRVYVNHSKERLSKTNSKARGGIVYHNHFLSYFRVNFERSPQYAKYHYYELAKCYLELGDKKKAWQYIVRFYFKPWFYYPKISRRDVLNTMWKLIKVIFKKDNSAEC